MLSDFENQLYGVAKMAGFTSLDETNEVMVRHAIEWYLIEIIWKRTPRFKNLQLVSSPLVTILMQVAKVAPEDDVIELVKTKLDLNLYNLNDECVEGLLPLLKADDAEALSRADALRLLSNQEHNQLRDRLVAVSAHPTLHAVLQERLPKKNCAFIDIVRTSETDRKVMKTKTYAVDGCFLSGKTQR